LKDKIKIAIQKQVALLHIKGKIRKVLSEESSVIKDDEVEISPELKISPV